MRKIIKKENNVQNFWTETQESPCGVMQFISWSNLERTLKERNYLRSDNEEISHFIITQHGIDIVIRTK